MNHTTLVDVAVVLEMIKAKHGDLVTLDVSTYTGVSRKARFIDKEYGEWWTLPSNVLHGCRHRKRADKFGAQSVKDFNAKEREQQSLALKSIEPTVREMYVERRLTFAQIRDECERLVGHKLTANGVAQFVQQLGIKRTAKQNRFYKVMNCEMCKQPFTARSGKQRWCRICVPFSTGLARKFGLSKHQYDELMSSQDNACAICRKSFDGMPTRQIHLDHCHDSNVIRGILCVNCNHGLGCFLDNIQNLKSAIAYLEEKA